MLENDEILYLHPRNECNISLGNGSVVQLVRIHACHAWGRGFESRPDRLMTKITVKAKKKRAIKSSLFYLREIFTDMRSMNRFDPLLRVNKGRNKSIPSGPPVIKEKPHNSVAFLFLVR